MINDINTNSAVAEWRQWRVKEQAPYGTMTSDGKLRN